MGHNTIKGQLKLRRSTFEFPSRVTFPVPVCTVPSSMDRTSRCNKVNAVRLNALYRFNLLLLKGQICVFDLRALRASFLDIKYLSDINVVFKTSFSHLQIWELKFRGFFKFFKTLKKN